MNLSLVSSTKQGHSTNQTSERSLVWEILEDSSFHLIIMLFVAEQNGPENSFPQNTHIRFQNIQQIISAHDDPPLIL
jgi:hypothetical protein